MPKTIEFELPSHYFEKDKEHNLMARLAKFDLESGDTARFFEIDEQDKRTGKFYDRTVKDLHKIHKAVKYWSWEDLQKYGFYVIQLEESKTHA